MSLRKRLEKLPDAFWHRELVNFRPVQSEEDLVFACCECQLTKEQQEVVNPAWFSIGRAYLSREDNYPCIILNEQMIPIGFINFCKWLPCGNAYSWSFFIDKRYQGRGYGRRTATKAVQVLKAADPHKAIKLAAEPDNKRAQALYIDLGFRILPELDGNDLVFAL